MVSTIKKIILICSACVLLSSCGPGFATGFAQGMSRGLSGGGASSDVRRELEDLKRARSIECINRGGVMVGNRCI